MRSVVVTGATSMIGVALIDELIKDMSVENIFAVVQPETSKWDRIPKDKRIIRVNCDLESYDKLDMLIKNKCECFYHLAWIRTATYDETEDDMLIKCRCIDGVIKAVEAAHMLGCSKVIWAGSQSEYGINDGKLGPDTPCDPVRADGVAHLAAGKLGEILAKKHDMAFIWMRIFSVYGKHDRPNSMISSTIRKLKNGEHCSFTPSEQLWEFLNAEDIGRAFYLVGKKINVSKIYCVGSGEEKPLRSFIETIRDIVSPETKLGIGELPYPADPVMRLCADISSLTEDTGWKPLISFEEGIQRLLDTEKSDKAL